MLKTRRVCWLKLQRVRITEDDSTGSSTSSDGDRPCVAGCGHSGRVVFRNVAGGNGIFLSCTLACKEILTLEKLCGTFSLHVFFE